MSNTKLDWVCIECGEKWGLWWVNGVYKGPAHHYATYHEDTCDVCSKTNVIVTETRDYGYLHKDWSCKNPVSAAQTKLM